MLRRWREEAGVAGAGGAGGSHVTTKIRLTATVAGGRRGEERYTCLVTLGLLNTTAIRPFSLSSSSSSRLGAINHCIIRLSVSSFLHITSRQCLEVEVEMEVDLHVISDIKYHLSLSSLPFVSVFVGRCVFWIY